MTIHESVKTMSGLIDLLVNLDVLFDDELAKVQEAESVIANYIKESGDTNA